jgi:D-alanyl-D-alanine carboxypeptidase
MRLFFCFLFFTTSVFAITPYAYLNKLVTKNHYVGIVTLLQTAPATITYRHAGLAHRIQKKPITNNSEFRIASATKPFIATTIIKLAIAHKLHLSDKLCDYLGEPFIYGIKNADQVTIRQLLGMQTGIYNYTDNPAFSTFVNKHPHHRWTPEDALNFARGMPAVFAPGTHSEYSNTNYILLGLVIERASHHSLAYELQHRIFTPLHLQHTFLEHHEKATGPIVSGYAYLGHNQYLNATHIDDGRGLADGGIVSTAHDLNHFIRSLMTNRHFMPKAWLDKMTHFHPMISQDHVDYGLGLIRFKESGPILIGHDGDDTGYQSWMVYNRKTKRSFVALSNTHPPVFNHRSMANALMFH